MMRDKNVVLVTGGSGCLGQHIIKHIQTRAPHVEEIRVLDKVPFVKKLDYEERVSVTSYIDDISDLKDTSAFRDVTSVFHLASIVSVTNFPDIKEMRRVNVKGTEKVLKACLKENVGQLIYASTVDVVCGYNAIVYGNEEDTKVPEVHLYKGYGGTKIQAERMVLSYNGTPLDSGGRLHTVALRSTGCFGELDVHYIPVVLRKARTYGRFLIQLGKGSALFHHSYVGNIAWAFLCAEQTLRQQTNSELPNVEVDSGKIVAGEVFFVTDDCEPRCMASQVEPFLSAAGYRLSRFKLPFKPVYGLVRLTEGILWVISPLVKVDLGFTSKSVRYANTSFSFSSDKARRLLGYSPIYTPEEAIERANKHYVEAFPHLKKKK